MKILYTNKRLIPRLNSINLKANISLTLKILPWLGLIICLGIIFFGKTPAAVKALDGGVAPPVPNLTLIVTDTPDPVKIGQVLTYTINLANDGAAEATNVMLASHLDSHVSFVSAGSSCSHDGQPTAGAVTCNLGTLAAGDTIALSLTVTIVSAPANGYLIANSTTAHSDEGAADCDTVTTTVIAPKLDIDKTGDPDAVALDDLLTYTLVISNAGYAEATNVVVTDTLDANVAFKSASHGGSHDGSPTDGVVTWLVGTIAPWEIITRSLTVTLVNLPDSNEVLNTACVTSGEGSNACDDEQTGIERPELEVIKLDDPDPVGLGQPLVYTIQVKNKGQARATNVLISDDLDSSVTFVAASHGGVHDGVNPNGRVTWPSLPVLQPQEIVTRSVSVTVVDEAVCGGTFPNMAEATSREGAGDQTTIDTTIGGGIITVNACEDQNADGVCGPGGTLPPGVLACLTDSGGAPVGACQPVSAEFSVAPGSYTVHLEFTGQSQGYYPTIASETVEVSQCGRADPTLPAVYPMHPKGVAVYEPLNKVYVAFQGPNEGNSWPYPFVAVIDGESDRVLRTIPGEENGIGRQPWGVAASRDGQYIYVSSFGEGRVSAIDPASDTIVENIRPGGDFSPTTAVVNPVNHWVHFADYKGGRMIALDGLNIVKEARIHIAPASFSPFEIAVADAGAQGYSYITMRDAIRPNPFRFATLNNETMELNHPTIQGAPHAIGLWQRGDEGHLFITYADDPRPNNEPFPNPNKLALYSFSASHPKDVIQRRAEIALGDYAEVGLVYDPLSDRMLGAYGGFAYDGSKKDDAACNSSKRGGVYTLDFEGNAGDGFAPNVVAGNPPLLASAGFDWKNPFEIAINPGNGKIYVTDRCWNDYPQGGKAGGGAVLIYDPNPDEPELETQALAASSDQATLVADANQDGQVDILDLTFIAARYGSDDPAADINGDGLVDILDMSLIGADYER